MKFLAKCEGDLSKPQNILAKLDPTTHVYQNFIENFQIKAMSCIVIKHYSLKAQFET
jgi:hypothetical protein